MQSYPTPSELLEQYPRFWSKVTFPLDLSQCWLWHGNKNRYGYGVFYPVLGGQRRTGAHRMAYELLVGPIPENLCIDHLCRVRLCVYPAHLEAVTIKNNILRGVGLAAINARKTHCIHGHEFNAANTLLGSGGMRRCRTCTNSRKRGYLKRKRMVTMFTTS